MIEDDRRKQQDIADLQAELSGAETGRQERFLTGEHSRRDRNTDRTQRSKFHTQLDMLLSDPVYQATYMRVSRQLDDAQEQLDGALLKAADHAAALTEQIESLMDGTAKLSDGTAVFLASDGMLYRSDGRRLEARDAIDIDIPADAPSWEEYRAAEDALKDVQRRLGQLASIQDDVLTPARDRLNDPDNPPELDDLEVLEEDIRRAMDEIEDAPSMASALNAAREPAPSAEPVDEDLIADLAIAPVAAP